ncbi:phosphate uptake regulator PhoU [Candidatus Omnitrophota bacterium]
MFESLLNFWKGKDFLIQVFDEFKNMLVDSQEMFEAVVTKLVRNEEVIGLKDKIYDLDKKVNSLEKDIRTRVAKHLLLNPSVDVTACLLLMSVVKDAERLGDYCKNLYEVTTIIKKPIDEKVYKAWFGDMDVEVVKLFKNTKKAFIESNEDKAAISWDFKGKIGKACDEILEKVSKSNLSVNEAVCFALMARYYKRITSHLTNIATSVILPISDLDYFDEKRK